MTPEESAVIEAAQELSAPSPEMPDLTKLWTALDALDASRAMEWRSRTWADVRKGDRIRLSHAREHEATVLGIMRNDWHVDPRSDPYRPRAAEWSQIRVTLAGSPNALPFDPSGEVEIHLDHETHDAMMMLGGWECRV